MKKVSLIVAVILFVTTSCNKNEEIGYAPIASFTVSPANGNIHTDFLFDASKSTGFGDIDGNIQLRWDFDSDGIWDVEWTSEKTAIYRYPLMGDYEAVLEVKNDNDLKDKATKDIFVDKGDNDPPDPPSNPIPDNNAINQNIDVVVSWVCTDPDQDVLVFDVYFGTDVNPPLVQSGVLVNNYDPGQLNVKTTYFWKIVASDNFGGITEGPVWRFTTADNIPGCPTSFLDIRDGTTYLAVSVGMQCWMAENLKYKTGNNWCYDNSTSNCDAYGRLYDFFTAINACPTGWRLPTDDEWKVLEGNVDSQFGVGNTVWNENDTWRGYDAGKNLKSIDGWYAGGNGSNNSGINVKPAGLRTQSGDFEELEKFAYFWTITSVSTGFYGRALTYDSDKIKREKVSSINGYSVRCIKN